MNLIIVDCQYDLCDPNGTLYVPGSEEALKNIEQLLQKPHFSKIIFTVDWHQVNDNSFTRNGGKWPVHCVQYSRGASLMPQLLHCVENIPFSYEVIEKGAIPGVEEYGAFYRSNKIDDDWNEVSEIQLQTVSNACIVPDEQFVVCGVAGDYCVKETLKNLLKYKPIVYTKGIASIDGGKVLKEFIKENNLKEYDY